MRLLPWSMFVLALAGVLGLSLHSRDLAERLGRSEIRARELEQARDEAGRRAAGAEARGEELQAQVAGLERRLEAALRREQEVLNLLRQRAEQEQAARQAAAAERDRWSAPPPEGVRLCLQALGECLRADGYPFVRFLRATALDDEGLHDVEVLDHDPQRMASVLYLAARMTATLDRGSGRLELRFFEGYRVAEGSRQELPEQGFPLVLESVYGPLWEERLPLLVRAEGVYPEDGDEPRLPALDPETRLLWQDRLDTLLARARYDKLRLKVASFRSLDRARFAGVTLLGYDPGHLLQMSATADLLAVEIDKDAGVVNLLLQGGTLRRKGGEAAISPSGLRLLLDGVTPQRAAEIMLGMVVQR